MPHHETLPKETEPFAFAREALSYISTYGTPPTPDIYEVWYRYAEGSNSAINEQLLHAVNVAKKVTVKQLQELRQQFLDSTAQSEVNAKISKQIAKEMEGLHSMIVMQQSANLNFGGSIELANERLQKDLVTPSDVKECLSSILQCNAKMQEQMANMDAKLNSSKHQIAGLQSTLDELHKEVQTDPLTRVGNRRLFNSMIEKANEPRPSEANDYLILVDLDKFKDINDLHGHSTGDEVLRFVANTLREKATGATITRYGGDEFAIFFSFGTEGTKQLTEDLCECFSQNTLTVQSTGEPVGVLTVSIGAAILRPEDNSDSWFQRADKLLYSAKSGGRNRAMIERKSSA